MVRKVVFLSLLVFASFHCLPQGVGKGSYTFLADTTTQTMALNCSTQDCEAFFNNAILFKRLKTLKLTGHANTLDFSALAFLPSLESLEINGSDTYDWKKLKAAKLGRALKLCANLNHLELSSCGIRSVPPSFSKLKKLRYIKLSNNRKKLKQPGIYKRLSRISTLDSLDISYNYLGKKYLHKKINSFVELDYLNVKGADNGLFLYGDLRRKKSKLTLHVKNLRLSNNDTYYYLFHSKLVPENRLYADYDVMTNREYSLIVGRTGRLSWGLDTMEYMLYEKEGGDNIINDKRFYGEFNTRNVDVKVLSLAYLHYPEFLKENYNSDIPDTIKFSERYKDLRYTGTDMSGFQLKSPEKVPARFMSKAKFNKLQHEFACPFNLIPETKGGNTFIASFGGNKDLTPSTYLLTEYPELNVFAGTKFVFNESGNGSPFNRCFRDLRIAYDEGADLFNLELKTQEGFETFNFRLMRGDSANTPENSQRIYASYREILQKKEEKFDSRLHTEVKHHMQKVENARKGAWKNFKKEYMSKAEKIMTLTEWETYCRAVTENEQDALYNSELSAGIFRRALEVKGFTELDPYQWYKQVEELSGITCTFEDINNTPIQPKKIIIIDKDNGVFTALNGPEYNSGCNLFFPSAQGRKYDLFIEFDNGNYSLVRNLEFTGTATFRNLLFRVEFLPPLLSDIHLVMRKLNY